MIDIDRALVARAQELAASQPRHPFTAVVGDARSLPELSESFDAVLLFGPLSQLTSRADRLKALSEARRVLKHGGFVFGLGLSRYASLLSGLFKGDRDLTDGQDRVADPLGESVVSANMYTHDPSELSDEMTEAGLDVIALLGVEGPAWLLAEQWNDPSLRGGHLFVARQLESETSLIGASRHILAVARRLDR